MDGAPTDLARLVLDKIALLGDEGAREYFEVSAGTISAWKNQKYEPSLSAVQKAWNESLQAQAPEIWGDVDRNTPIKLLMPMYETLEPLTFFTLVRACKLYGFDKIGIMPKWRTLVVEARNDLAEKALLTPSEWFIYVDADGVFPCGSGAILRKYGCEIPEPKASRNAIERLMSHPKDKLIVGGVYKDRRKGTQIQAEPAFRNAKENERLMKLYTNENKSDSLEKVGWVGFGLVRIHRSVFERMKEAAKGDGPLAEIAPPPGRDGEPYGYFSTTRAQRGEDVAFCRRAQKLGIETWLDHGLCMGHIGKIAR